MKIFKSHRHDLIVLLSVLCFVFLLSSCVQETPTPVILDTVDAFLQAMGEMGVQATIFKEEGPTIVGLSPTGVRLGNEQLLIYNSIETLDSTQVLDQLEEDPGRRYLWVGEYLILLYTGNDGGTVLLVESLFGDPIIGPPAPGDEPYPPAIPAAIQTVAAALGVEPTDVEVLAYEMRDWPDPCLDYKELDEICDEEITPGWRIDLRQGNVEIEVHTDMLGMNIRWRSH